MEEIMSGIAIEDLALYVRMHGLKIKDEAELFQCLHWLGVDVSTIETSIVKENNNGQVNGTERSYQGTNGN